MEEYEIVIFNANSAPSFFIEDTYLDDNAAIRAAEALAKGQRFEVWRGLDCIVGVWAFGNSGEQRTKSA